MPTIREGKKVPAFTARATSGREINSADLLGRAVVVYFYPKDDTPGCTREGEDFRDNYERFSRQKAVILGVSRDSLESHETFRAKFEFPFELISDPEEQLCRLFDVIKEKTLYGKKHMGIERSTFLIDADGVLRKAWRDVKVDGHAEEVLEAVKAL